MAGFLLAFAIDRIELIPGILIFLPGFLEMRGNISGSMSSRLSSALFLGIIKPKVRKNRVIRGNIIATFFLAIIVSLVLGIIAYFVNLHFFGIVTPEIILIALIAGILANTIQIPLTLFTTFWLFRHGHDPNNIMGPYLTSTGDVISIISLLIAIVIV